MRHPQHIHGMPRLDSAAIYHALQAISCTDAYAALACFVNWTMYSVLVHRWCDRKQRAVYIAWTYSDIEGYSPIQCVHRGSSAAHLLLCFAARWKNQVYMHVIRYYSRPRPNFPIQPESQAYRAADLQAKVVARLQLLNRKRHGLTLPLAVFVVPVRVVAVLAAPAAVWRAGAQVVIPASCQCISFSLVTPVRRGLVMRREVEAGERRDQECEPGAEQEAMKVGGVGDVGSRTRIAFEPRPEETR